jgi:SpoVK/Ycf46/Vps4 family AAA+-type ATPase
MIWFYLLQTNDHWFISVYQFLRKDYQKLVYIPRPDYGTRLDMWREFLIPHNALLHYDIHYSLLAKLSDSWTAGKIKNTVQGSLKQYKKGLNDDQLEKELQETDPMFQMETKGKKISKVGRRMIRMNDIMEAMSNNDPIFLEQDKVWNNWFNKTTLQKQRLSTQLGGGKGDKKKKKGKKGKKGKRK